MKDEEESGEWGKRKGERKGWLVSIESEGEALTEFASALGKDLHGLHCRTGIEKIQVSTKIEFD
jgi:hypothetical protein